MKCATCGGSGGGLASHACVEALADRVAKLEVLIARKLAPTIAAHAVDPALLTCSACLRKPVHDALCPKYAAAHLSGTTLEEAAATLASGQLASAGEATVPTGWKLAPGWADKHNRVGHDPDECSHTLTDDDSSDRNGFDCTETAVYLHPEGHGACDGHAEVMGALVRGEPPAEQPRACLYWCWRYKADAPLGLSVTTGTDGIRACSQECYAAGRPINPTPAEQPSRQETGEGETVCKSWCGLPSETLVNGYPFNSDKRRIYCTEACRDRAKAKAAERAKCSTCLMSVLHADGSEVALHPNHTPAEPSGTGQLQSAPDGFRVVGRSGPYVEQDNDQYTVRRGHETVALCGARPQVQWDAGCYDILEPIAEPPAPAAGTLSERVLSMLKERSSAPSSKYQVPVGYIIVAKRWIERTADEVAALEARLAQAEEGNDRAARMLEVSHAGNVKLHADRAELRERVAALEARLAQAKLFLWVKNKVVSGALRRAEESDGKLAQAKDDAQRAIQAATESLTKDAADLRTKLAQAERERDEAVKNQGDYGMARNAFDKAAKERDEWRDEATARLNVAVTAKRERDELAAKLLVARLPADAVEIGEGSRDGKPAPGTDNG